MTLGKSLRFQLRPPRLADPDFGRLTFMDIPGTPERSYWEAEWVFPPRDHPVSIALEGDESGPSTRARDWHLRLPAGFPRILELARPRLAGAIRSWLGQELPEDIFTVVRLSGFGVEDLDARPLPWDISFETVGDKWLGITIPFVGDDPQEPVVDT